MLEFCNVKWKKQYQCCLHYHFTTQFLCLHKSHLFALLQHVVMGHAGHYSIQLQSLYVQKCPNLPSIFNPLNQLLQNIHKLLLSLPRLHHKNNYQLQLHDTSTVYTPYAYVLYIYIILPGMVGFSLGLKVQQLVAKLQIANAHLIPFLSRALKQLWWPCRDMLLSIYKE